MNESVTESSVTKPISMTEQIASIVGPLPESDVKEFAKAMEVELVTFEAKFQHYLRPLRPNVFGR